ncbi:MAG: hypothetical protein MJB12_14695 [Firmicutes bacterium]|nr:hypothetical protein [Bacillota bacterium]
MEKFNISSLQNMAADRGVSVGTILKGVVLAYAIALIIFLIFAALITYSDFPGEYNTYLSGGYDNI